MSAPPPRDDEMDDSPELVDADEVLEEIEDVEGDVAMDSDDGDDDMDEPQEIHMVNDSIAYFDAHKDSVFTIAQHPTLPSLIATGGSDGDGDDAPGMGYVFDTSGVSGRPVLPPSYATDPSQATQKNTELTPLFALEGHTDSINAVAFTLPRGEYLVSGGLDGRLRAYQLAIDGHNKAKLNFVGEAQEVPEINWVAPCPYAATPNTIALGGSDGSVWVYTIDASDKSNPLQIVQTYFMHTGACTAGAWSPDGLLLATVSEDSSLCVWDVWGEAAAKGLTNDNGQTVVSLTGEDQRFEVEGGLYSVAIDPKSTLVAVGGAGGAIKIVGLPRLNNETAPQAQPQSSRQSKTKAKGGDAGSSQAGTILASLHTQGDGIETLLLAAGSVDGSIAVYDMTKSFAVRRHLREAHEEFSVVKVDFVKGNDGWILTSCVVSSRSGGVTGGDGEGGGVLGFVQGTGDRVVTAGDDGIVLVFEA
ncbi:hypothetical protein PG987_015728 [Apiospora arundinis]